MILSLFSASFKMYLELTNIVKFPDISVCDNNLKLFTEKILK